MAVGFDVWVIGLLNGMVGYSVMAERKEREKQRSVWRRERERENGEKRNVDSVTVIKLEPT